MEDAYEDYTVHKQTYAELEVKYNLGEKTIRKYFDKLKPQKPSLITDQNPVNLIFDTTFFKRVLGVMVFRTGGGNLSWRYVETEKLSFYLEELCRLVDQGYNFKSFTIDGRKGLISLLQRQFASVPIQMCQFHQVAIVIRYITMKPKTECGQELKSLILNLKKLSKREFVEQLKKLELKHQDFLKQKNEQNKFKHKSLRSALRSIKTNLPYLFTFEDYPELSIPKTSNSCEGSFGHWKYKVKLHRHLESKRLKQLIDNLLGFKKNP